MNALQITLIVLLLTFMSQAAQAHTDHDKARFVAENGIDTGNCDNRFRPCKTLTYAARQANKGDKILVAEGQYFFDNAQQAQVLNDSLLPVLGGFSRKDHFQAQKPALHKTTLLNVPVYLSEALYQKGFDTIVDGKATVPFSSLTAQHMEVSTTVSANESCSDGTAADYPCNNIDLLSHVPVSVLSSVSKGANDIWGHVDLNNSREYAIVGMQASIAVVDVTEPTSPVVVGEITGQSTSWRDIKVYQYFDSAAGRFKAYAYASADSVTEGFTIIDLNDLPESISLVSRNTDDNRAHNIYISNVDYTLNIPLTGVIPQLHLVGQDSNGGAFRSYALSSPRAPTASYVPSELTRADYTHDASSMHITDARAEAECVSATASGCTVMLDFNEGSMRLWDHTDTDSTSELSSTSYNEVAYTHSGWFSEDKHYAFVHDELDERNFSLNTRVMIFDISSLTAPVLAGVWTSDNDTIDHNGYVRGNRYYMSNYERGLTVLDISDPTAPEEVGFFDTYPAFNSTNFNGAWGVYPFLPSGNIIVSDIQRGLFVLKDNTLTTATVVAFSQSSYETEADTTFNLPVTKSGDSAMSVNYEVLSGSATSDDVLQASGELTWGANDTEPKNVTLSVSANDDTESDEILFVRLFNPQGGGIASGSGYTQVTILGTAQQGKVELNTAERAVLETDPELTLSLARQGGSEGEVSVNYSLENGTAVSGEDFVSQSGTLTWSDGDTVQKTVTVTLINDSIEEDSEQFRLVLTTEDANLLGGVAETLIVIKDDESNQAPIVNAGTDVDTDVRASVELTGSAQDPEGNLASIEWTQTAGETVAINSADTLTMSFTAPANASNLTFALNATDEFGVSSSDTVVVNVNESAASVPVENSSNSSSGGGTTTLLSICGLILALGLRRVQLPIKRPKQ
ncbi:choice-of-anchor B family protein [Alteromonas sp. S005]|uniref:choice-of-anchor B family protein n=1 Tax=Alteromonas sp. S005 TaxID=3117400 RepID=UPI002FE23B71